MFVNLLLFVLFYNQSISFAYEVVGNLPKDAVPYYFEQSVEIKLPEFSEITMDEREMSAELLAERPSSPHNLPLQKDFSKEGQFFHDLEVMRVHYRFLEDGHRLEYYADVAEFVHKLLLSGLMKNVEMAEHELYLSKMSIASCHELNRQIGEAVKHCKSSKTASFGYKLRHDPKCIIALTNIDALQEFHSELENENSHVIKSPVLYRLGKKKSTGFFQKTKQNLSRGSHA